MLNTHTSTSTTPTFITKALCHVTYVTTAVLNDCYSEVMACIALAYSIQLVSMTHMDAYVMPTNDTNYRCHIKATELA